MGYRDMINNMNNLKSKLIKKVANTFIDVGEKQKDQLSFGLTFYEPKISMNLLNSDKKSIR